MYNKLFTKILDSSIWLEDTSTRLVWITLLAAMDEDGMCQFASVGNLAHRARVTMAEAEGAVCRLEAVDAHSSDPENEGRRIERVPGGWIVLNCGKYREQINRSVQKQRTREKVAAHRARRKAEVTSVTCNQKPVTSVTCNPCNQNVTPAEAAAEANTEAEAEKTGERAVPARGVRLTEFFDSDGNPASAEIVMEEWNKLPACFPKIKEITKTRKAQLSRMLNDDQWLNNWREALRLAPSMPFLCGQSDRGWKMDFDWFIKKPDHLLRIIEGKYGGARHGSPAKTVPLRQNEVPRPVNVAEELKRRGIA